MSNGNNTRTSSARKSGKGQITRNDRRRDRKKPLIAMRLEEVAVMLDGCLPLRAGPTSEISAGRLRAAMVLLDRTGIRVSELLDLIESDLIHDDQTIIIRNGKGGKRRLVGMDAWGWNEIDRWIEIRNEFVKPGYLLPNIQGVSSGAKWADCDLRRQLSAAAKRCGLKHTAHPHAWRHGFTVRARRDGIDVVTLSAQLGHADLTTTQIYLDSVDPVERLMPVILRGAPMIELPHARRSILR